MRCADGRADPLHPGEAQPHRERAVAAMRRGLVGSVEVEEPDRRLVALETGVQAALGR